MEKSLGKRLLKLWGPICEKFEDDLDSRPWGETMGVGCRGV